MAEYRDALPQLGPQVLLADSGLETDLIFNRGIDLPEFASFPLLRDEEGRAALERYFRDHADAAAALGTGIVLETPTWRASRDWGARLGFTPGDLAEFNRAAVGLVQQVRAESTAAQPIVVSGNIGPRGDAYRPESLMSADEAHAYHDHQVEAFAGTDVDVVTAMTLTYVDEALGVARAAEAAGLPVVLSFTVETDGVLPDGTEFGAAITAVDDATDGYPAYYMLNCAHPDHFDAILDPDAAWAGRLRGIRANASRMSHAELDESEVLDDGDPDELAASYAALRERMPQLTVLGGCCGTDVRHVEAIARACVS